MANHVGETYSQTDQHPPLSAEQKELAAIALHDGGHDSLASAISDVNGYPVRGYAMFVVRSVIQAHVDTSGGHPEGQAFLDSVKEWDGPVVAL
jgi:hypothetical protein